MSLPLWVENPGIYLGRELNDGVLISGPITVKDAGREVAKATQNMEGRVIMYKSKNGKPPILEIIMELLYRGAAG
ncbi:MAG: hypothetical protein V1487_03620 [bacterium]